MSLTDKDILYAETEEGTIGGDTNWVELSTDPGNLQALCLTVKKDGTYCANVAGHNTLHLGTGRCSHHGGVKTTRDYKTGAHAVVARTTLQQKISKYAEGDAQKLYDLTEEIATLKILLQQNIEHFPDSQDANYLKMLSLTTRRITELTSAISSLIDKASKIDSRNALTAAHVNYLRARVADILVKYIPDPDTRKLAIEDLASSVPDGVQNVNKIESKTT